MRHPADDWPKALLNGVLVGAILFLSILPALGWAWHRVLPEHMHVFVGVAHSDEDEILPPSTPDASSSLCSNCSGTQIGPGIVHLPGNAGLQVLDMAALSALHWVFAPPSLAERIGIPTIFYRPPLIFPPDPPPNASI
jgi:hypothetical protein